MRLSLSRSHRPRRRTSCSEPTIAQRDETAYVLLAEARLRSEWLCANAERLCADPERLCADPEREREPQAGMPALHRELGRAAYHASERIPSDRRRALLEQARAAAQRAAHSDRERVDALQALTVQAEQAVRQCLVAPGLTDHMNHADLHLRTGRELLADLTRITRSEAAPRAAAAAW
ncbi:MAG: hypothetical protein ACRDL8_13380 [Solirubrobacteraceae bacterium]